MTCRYVDQDSNFFHDYLALLGTLQPAPCIGRAACRRSQLAAHTARIQESVPLRLRADGYDPAVDEGGWGLNQLPNASPHNVQALDESLMLKNLQVRSSLPMRFELRTECWL